MSEALQRHPEVDPRRVELEILETAKLHDLTEVAEVVRAARDLGIYFAIDDFGTGYSSLSWLKYLKVRTLKIDQSFVRDMLEDPDDLSIVDGVVGLALAFGRQVVAEGVETVAHGRLLLQLGCDRAQGYGIARPMPPEQLPEWAVNWKQPAEWQDVSPWPREDLPLLTVEIDHQRWVTQFSHAIAAAPHEIEAPELDSHVCRFGRWLNGDGQARYGHHSAFVALVPIHDAVHSAGRTLIELHRIDPDGARARRLIQFAPSDFPAPPQ